MLYPLRSKFFPNQPIVAKYKKYRSYSRDLVHEIVKVVDKKGLQKAVQIMGISQGKQLLLDDDELSFFMDYLLFEHEAKGKNTLTLYQEQQTELEPIEAEILSALAANFISLFKIVETDRESASIVLEDLLNETDHVVLTDIAMSQTAPSGLLIFTRIIPLTDFKMHSGMFAIFPATAEKVLIKRHKALMQRVKSTKESAKLLIAFFKLNRTEGLLVGTRSLF